MLAGGCVELGTDGLPFAPFTAVLRELVRDLGADGVAGLLPGGVTRDFARLLPEFGPADGERGGERHRGQGAAVRADARRCSSAWPMPGPWCC